MVHVNCLRGEFNHQPATSSSGASRVRETGNVGSSSWVYIWKLVNGKVHSYDQFNDAGLAEAFR